MEELNKVHNKGKWYIYNNHGSIKDVKKFLDDAEAGKADSAKLFDSVNHCLEFIANMKHPDYLDKTDLSVKYYAYDNRICRDIFIILTDRFGDDNYLKHYGVPQFISFMTQV